MIDTGGYHGRQTREEVLARLSDGTASGRDGGRGGGGSGEGRPLMVSWHSSSAPLIKIHVQPYEKCMTPSAASGTCRFDADSQVNVRN